MAEDQTAELSSSARKYWSDEGFSDGGVLRQVDYSAESRGLDPALHGIKIVDCDTHVTEAPDLFTSRFPARLKDRAPYIKRKNGVDRWFVGDRDFGSTGGNVIRADNHKLLGRLAFPKLEQGHPGAWETKPRLQAMDDMGVHAQICYHNSGVTQAGSLMSLGDNELAIEVLKTYNDAGAERQQASGQRLFTMGHLPLWDRAAMEAEAKRCIDMDLKGFVLPDTPERLGLPSFIDDYWTPTLDILSESGRPINFHLNAAINPADLAWQGMGFEQTLSIASTMYSIGNSATLGNWIVSGRLDRHPKLKIGLVESGMGWVPFALEAYEHQFNEMLPNGSKLLSRRPKEYFRDHFWVTYWFEEIGPRLLLEEIGVDKVLFETDYPHPTSLYPGVQQHILRTLGGFDHAVRKKVLESNAVKLFDLPF